MFDENTGDAAALEDALAAFDIAVSRVEDKAVKAVQRMAQAARRDVAKAFASERYHTDRGAKKPLGSITPRWKKMKAAYGYKPEKGHATGGIQKVFNATKAAKKTKRGFVLDFTGVAETTTTRYRTRRIGAKRRRKGVPTYRKKKVGDYLRHYADSKAPSLGALSKAFRKDLEKAVDKAVGKDLQRLTKSAAAGALATDGHVFKLRLDKFGLERAA